MQEGNVSNIHVYSLIYLVTSRYQCLRFRELTVVCLFSHEIIVRSQFDGIP